MKKIVLFLSLLLTLPLMTFAQERTVTVTPMSPGVTYSVYNGTAADTIVYINQDTIDVVFTYRGPAVSKLAVESLFSPISGADTTVSVSVYGREFEGAGAYTEIIAPTVSSAVTANSIASVLSATAANAVNGDESFRQFRIRYIIQGQSAAGSGITLDAVKLKIYD